jgi:dihydrodipicolinate synthase/N-acetylneuraminate lyase
MRRESISPSDLRGVFPVPPLARNSDTGRTFDFAENDKMVRHMTGAGITRLLYGGNAFLYHISLSEYEQLIGWLSGLEDHVWVIPSAGPSYGRLMDQAAILRRYSFPCVMTLPCADPRDATGLERGFREFAAAVGVPLMLYLKEEHNFGVDKLAGLDAVSRLVQDGLCVAIKYAVVRENPAEDAYLAALLERVDRKYVISGIGERPAIVHLRDWGLPGFTTGSGCVAPALSQSIFDSCANQRYEDAASTRRHFLPLEDLRDKWGPARVLHAAIELAGISRTGPIPPFVSPITANQREQLAPVARELAEVQSPSLVR